MKEKKNLGEVVREIGKMYKFMLVPGSFVREAKKEKYKNRLDKNTSYFAAYAGEAARIGMYGTIAYLVNNM